MPWRRIILAPQVSTESGYQSDGLSELELRWRLNAFFSCVGSQYLDLDV